MELNEKKKQGGLKTALIAGLGGLIIGGAAVGIIYYNAVVKPTKEIPAALENLVTEGEETFSLTELESLIESASDLVSEKYHYTAVAKYQKEGTKLGSLTVPLTEETTLILYSGTISAGIDVSKIACDIDEEKKIITLTLPEPKIIAHEIDHDSVESYEVKNAIFSKKTYEDFAETISAAQKEEEENLKADGKFFEDVSKDAENVLNNLLTATGADENYKIVFEQAS